VLACCWAALLAGVARRLRYGPGGRGTGLLAEGRNTDGLEAVAA